MSSKKLGPNQVEIVARATPGTIEKPYQCENRIGTLEGVGKLVTKKCTEIEHPTCIHKGDGCCRYILTWEKTAALIWKRIGNFVLPAALLSVFSICLSTRRESVSSPCTNRKELKGLWLGPRSRKPSTRALIIKAIFPKGLSLPKASQNFKPW